MPMTNPFWALLPESAQNVLNELATHLVPPNAQANELEASPVFPTASMTSSESSKYSGYSIQDGVAVISINGPILRKGFSFYGWSQAGQDEIAKALENALADSAVRAILFSINSPGGTVAGTKELADRIAEASAIKPMAAYADGLMASAAIWLGAATGKIYAPSTASVGSVGVIMVHADYSKQNERWGVSYTTITGGKLKSSGNPDKPLSDEAFALFQKQVTQIHDIFKADVANGLGITAPAEQWAEGQTMLACEAKEFGLVTDIVRDVNSAINLLSREAIMDLKTFAAKHPELLAEIESRAEAKGKAEAEAMLKDAQSTIKDAQNAVLAIVNAVAGDDVSATVTKLVEANVTPAQMEAMSSLMPKPSEKPETNVTAQSSEELAKANILAAITAATPSPVPGKMALDNSDKAETQAAIDRMAKM